MICTWCDGECELLGEKITIIIKNILVFFSDYFCFPVRNMLKIEKGGGRTRQGQFVNGVS